MNVILHSTRESHGPVYPLVNHCKLIPSSSLSDHTDSKMTERWACSEQSVQNRNAEQKRRGWVVDLLDEFRPLTEGKNRL